MKYPNVRKEQIHTSRALGAWPDDWAARKKLEVSVVFLTIHAKKLYFASKYILIYFYYKNELLIDSPKGTICMYFVVLPQAHCRMPLVVHTADGLGACCQAISWFHPCILLPKSCILLLMPFHLTCYLLLWPTPQLDSTLRQSLPGAAGSSTPLATFFLS